MVLSVMNKTPYRFDISPCVDLPVCGHVLRPWTTVPMTASLHVPGPVHTGRPLPTTATNNNMLLIHFLILEAFLVTFSQASSISASDSYHWQLLRRSKVRLLFFHIVLYSSVSVIPTLSFVDRATYCGSSDALCWGAQGLIQLGQSQDGLCYGTLGHSSPTLG